MKEEFSLQLKVNPGLNQADIKKAGFQYIRNFSVLSLSDGQEISFKAAGVETGLIVLKGKCDIVIDGKIYKDIGERQDYFTEKPTGVYIPRNKAYEIMGRPVEIALCAGRCDKDSEFTIVRPAEVKEMEVGKDNWKRRVRMILGPQSPAVNLIVGETMNPAGNWSGTPAHKHERDNLPSESLQEELYYFRTEKPQGFGIERLYSPQRNINELVYLKNDTVTFMPWGYHQIVSAPGYALYYSFFLSGPKKELIGYADPDHKWINA